MKRSLKGCVAGIAAWSLLATVAAAAAPAAPGKTLLRYKFAAGETLRWQVDQKAEFETTVSGTRQPAETTTRSIKVWKVKAVAADGTATIENSVEAIDMRQRLVGRMELHYDSRSGEKPPLGFEQAAAMVGKPISAVKLDALGTVLDRRILAEGSPTEKDAPITLTLPREAVAVGEKWNVNREIDVPLEGGLNKKVRVMQVFTLAELKGNVATIRTANQVLTPIDDPAIEVQLIQRESAGTIRFDVAAGRMLGQKVELDKTVVGFRGEASSLHYVMHLTEELLGEGKAVKEASAPTPPAAKTTAEKPPAPERR